MLGLKVVNVPAVLLTDANLFLAVPPFSVVKLPPRKMVEPFTAMAFTWPLAFGSQLCKVPAPETASAAAKFPRCAFHGSEVATNIEYV